MSFTSTSDEPSEEKVFANLMQWSFRSSPSIAFKDIEFIRNPNFSLNDCSSLNLLFNELIAISTITKK